MARLCRAAAGHRRHHDARDDDTVGPPESRFCVAVLGAACLRVSGNRGLVDDPRAIRARSADGGVRVDWLHADPDLPACYRWCHRINARRCRFAVPPPSDAVRPVSRSAGLGGARQFILSGSIVRNPLCDWFAGLALQLWSYDFGLCLHRLVALCIALILAVLSERYEVVAHFWSPI